MIRRILALSLICLAPSVPAAENSNPDKVRSTRDFGPIRREVETLRGKKFLHEVPVYKISKKELRTISDHEIDKQYPGEKLPHYEELLAWLDYVPPHTDLKQVEADFCADQVDGFYVDDLKQVCIPVASLANTNAHYSSRTNVITPDLDGIVLSHEFTHALEDQYWPLDDPKDNDERPSTDRGTAHDFVAEGSATREMTEAMPDQFAGGSPDSYFMAWNFLHSDPVEAAVDHVCRGFWKASSVSVPGVPDTVAREESIPYAYGYSFCTKFLRAWGLDGLDYVYNHPAISSAQVMHPKKFWEWRDLPVQIDLPTNLPGGWKQISIDSEGEAGIAILFGCQFTNLNRGLEIGRGWKGDHVALYAGPGGHRLLLWASAWNSKYDAGLFLRSCVRERQLAHQAVLSEDNAKATRWKSADGRIGFIHRDGKRVILVETDDVAAVGNAAALAGNVVFTPPAEETARAAVNTPLRRFNPFWSRQQDGDYVVSRSLIGIVSRHDRNSVGAADTYLGGMLGESRRTKSFHKWEIGGGWVMKHEAEDRRGFAKTTLLPWGVLASHCVSRRPKSPDKTISRSSILWGAAGSVSTDETGGRSFHLLPFGLLFCRTTGAGVSSTHILGTGVFYQQGSKNSGAVERFRLLGFPLWTTHLPRAKI